MISRNNSESFYSLFLRYDVLLCLSLVFVAYLLARAKQSRQATRPIQAAKPIQAISPHVEVKKTPASVILQQAFDEAKKTYEEENRTPLGKSKLGGHFGFFSWLRHGEYPKDFERELFSSQDESLIRNVTIKYLRQRGSLWDASTLKSNNHSFMNYFLTYLRRKNLDEYRFVVGEAYEVAFIKGKIKLFRRDSRPPEVIFREGFKLKDDQNKYSTRKRHYTRPYTYSYGVSFSKKIPPAGYGSSFYYYEVELPDTFLLVDIVRSEVNRDKLTEYHFSIEEVNSLEDIPGKYVKAAIYDNGYTEKNPNFAPGDPIDQAHRVFRGCY